MYTNHNGHGPDDPKNLLQVLRKAIFYHRQILHELEGIRQRQEEQQKIARLLALKFMKDLLVTQLLWSVVLSIVLRAIMYGADKLQGIPPLRMDQNPLLYLFGGAMIALGLVISYRSVRQLDTEKFSLGVYSMYSGIILVMLPVIDLVVHRFV